MKPLTLGVAEIAKVLEFDRNPIPLGMALPAVTDADLNAARDWLDDPGIGQTVGDSVLDLSFHSYVLRIGDWTAVIDTGLGNGKRRGAPIAFADGLDTPYLARLAALGITPDAVDAVLCTHLHFDHVGWNTSLTDGRWLPTFPRARYVFSRRDFEYFAAGGDPVSSAAFDDSVLPVIQAGQADLVADCHVVLDDGRTRVWLESAAGHTPGNMVIRLDSEGQGAIFSGDVIHHPLQLVRPELSLAVEERPEAAAKVRSDLLANVASTGTGPGTLLCTAHFRGASAGHVSRSAGGYRWHPWP